MAVNYCSSTLLHHHRLLSSANRYSTTVTQLSDCNSRLYQQTVETHDSDDLTRPLAYGLNRPFAKPLTNIPNGKKPCTNVGARLEDGDYRPSDKMVGARRSQITVRSNGSGLMVRGAIFYARWMIPRPLQVIVGRSHFVKSLRTKNLIEAKRLIKAAGWEFETMLRHAEGKAIQQPPAPPVAAPQHFAAPILKPKIKRKTFEQVFELFINDPTRKRAQKTLAGYRDGIEIIYAVIGRETPIEDIDREACRKLLDTLRWLPTNSPKKFPTLTAVQAAKMAKEKGRTDLLGPVSINGYMITRPYAQADHYDGFRL